MRYLTRTLLASILIVFSQVVSAVPLLQLDIGGGSYDPVDQSIYSNSASSTVYAYAKPKAGVSGDAILSDTFYLSVALVAYGPVSSPSAIYAAGGANLGSFSINGAQYNVTSDLLYGVPPVDANLGDHSSLAKHGIFPSYFMAKDFQFSSSQRSEVYNTQDNAGNGPIASDGSRDDMYYAAFNVDVNLVTGYGLHFDLYSLKTTGKKCSFANPCIDRFAPFSHDAYIVPEPGVLLLFAIGLIALGFRLRKQST